jgi:hypothetical protein
MTPVEGATLPAGDTGLNTASVLGVSFGRHHPEMVGRDLAASTELSGTASPRWQSRFWSVPAEHRKGNHRNGKRNQKNTAYGRFGSGDYTRRDSMFRLNVRRGLTLLAVGFSLSLSLHAAQSAPQSRSGTPLSLDDGYGKALVFTGDFEGKHRAELLSYYTDTRDWVLRDYDGSRMGRAYAGNTGGFGDLADGRPLWAGSFAGDGQSQILFYYPGDRNWWLGSMVNGQLTWRLVDNTAGFGNVWDGRPFFIGNFSRTDRAQLLFYHPGDSNWWLGTFDGATIGWTLAGNTRGFGNLNRGQPFLIDDFDGDQKTDVMFYSPGDHNWWLATFQETQMRWVCLL